MNDFYDDYNSGYENNFKFMQSKEEIERLKEIKKEETKRNNKTTLYIFIFIAIFMFATIGILDTLSSCKRELGF